MNIHMYIEGTSRLANTTVPRRLRRLGSRGSRRHSTPSMLSTCIQLRWVLAFTLG